MQHYSVKGVEERGIKAEENWEEEKLFEFIPCMIGNVHKIVLEL